MKIQFVKKNGNLIPYSEKDRELIDEFKDGAIYVVDIKNSDLRTLKQNRALWLWFTQISNKLNKDSFAIQDVIKLNTKWSPEKIKELIFKPVIKSLYDKESSTKLLKDEFELLIDTIIQALGTKGIECPDFPNREDLESITYKKEN